MLNQPRDGITDLIVTSAVSAIAEFLVKNE